MVVFKFHDLRVIFLIALFLYYELVVVIVAMELDNHEAAPRTWRHAGDDGDHARTLEMEIKSAKKRPYHITLFMPVMFILFCILFCLVTAVAL